MGSEPHDLSGPLLTGVIIYRSHHICSVRLAGRLSLAHSKESMQGRSWDDCGVLLARKQGTRATGLFPSSVSSPVSFYLAVTWGVRGRQEGTSDNQRQRALPMGESRGLGPPILYPPQCLHLYSGARQKQARPGGGHGTTDWFQIGKGVRQGFILSPCLFNLYAEYIMRNAGLEEAQAGINPLQYSCLENLMGGGAWWAAVHGVTKSRTRLKRLSSGGGGGGGSSSSSSSSSSSIIVCHPPPSPR